MRTSLNIATTEQPGVNLVTLDMQMNDNQRITLSLLVNLGPDSVAAIQRQLIRDATRLLAHVAAPSHGAPPNPSA